jgi:hypothetical protein
LNLLTELGAKNDENDAEANIGLQTSYAIDTVIPGAASRTYLHSDTAATLKTLGEETARF